MTVSSRPLTPAERYYAFLDPVCPMNLILSAELDTCLPVDLVEARWRAIVGMRSVLRFRIMEDLTLADRGTADIDFEAIEAPSAAWDEQFTVESRQPFGFDRPMRCLYLTSPDEGRSRLAIVGHHAAFDGRVGCIELQQVLRLLDGQAIDEQTSLSVAVPSTTTYPWQADRRTMVAALRAIAERSAAVGEPEPRAWPKRDGGHRPRFASLPTEPEESKAFLASVKAHGATAFPAIAAGWLVALANQVCEQPDRVLQMVTPVDRAVPSDDPDRATSPVVAMLAGRYRVPADPWALAPEVAAKVRASLAEGEGELFFQLTRANDITDAAAGAAVVAHSLGSAPPSVSVTNFGVLDPGSDPAWVRSICGYLSPSPNHVVFVSGTGYRGRLVQSFSSDDGQFPPERAQAVLDEYAAVRAAMSVPA